MTSQPYFCPYSMPFYWMMSQFNSSPRVSVAGLAPSICDALNLDG